MSLELGEFIKADLGYSNGYHTPVISLRFAVICYHPLRPVPLYQVLSLELAEESGHRLCGGLHLWGDNASRYPVMLADTQNPPGRDRLESAT